MIENTLWAATTIATISAAVSAWFSFKVSKNALEFQKNYAKNQNLINELDRTINKAKTLQILMLKPLEISGSELESLDTLLSELKLLLGRFKNLEYEQLKIYSVEDHLGLAKNHSCLDEVISELEKIKSKVFK